MRLTMAGRVLPLCILAVFAGCESPTDSVTQHGPSFARLEAGAEAVEGRFIVVGASDELPASLAVDVRAYGGRVLSEIPEIGIAIVQSDDQDFEQNLSKLPGVGAVILDELIEYEEPFVEGDPVDHASVPDAGFADALTWGLDAVGAPAAWAAGHRGAGVRVAVVDAGVDISHPDIIPNLNVGLSTSFVPCIVANCDGPIEDWRILPGFYFNHGTHVAGTIGAAGTLGVTGVAPEAELVVVKACTEFFNACFTSSIVSSLVYAANIDADLVNMSIGGLRRMRNDFVPFCSSLGLPTSFCGKIARFFATGQDDYVHNRILVFQRAFEYAHRQGTTVIIAAGNNGLDADRSKDIRLAFADFPHTIAVSALSPIGWCLDVTTSPDVQTEYTNYGQSVIDFAGPGGSFRGFTLGPPYSDPCFVPPVVRSAYIFDAVLSTIAGGWGWASGTSMAAPHATGVAALLISANGGPMSPQEVASALKRTAVDLGSPGHDAVYGSGRVFTGY